MKTGIYWQDPKYALKPGRGFIFDPSLVLYLPLHKLDGASIVSCDAYGHLCSVTGAIWTPQGRSFDGLDDNITSGAHAALAIANTITLEAWVNPFTIAAGTMTLFEVNAGVNSGISLNVNQGAGGKMQGWFYGTDSAWHGTPGTAVLTAGRFLHLVITYDKKQFKEFANGIFQDQSAYTVAIEIGSTQSAHVGESYAGSNDFQGTVGEVRIYNRALTPLEIQQNYLATKWRYQ